VNGDAPAIQARGTVSSWDVERKIAEDGTAGHLSRTGSDSGVSALADAGTAIRFRQRGTVRVEFQRYFKFDSDDIGGRTDIDALSIDAPYHFWTAVARAGP
jgi:hypothetical protein